MRGLAQLIKSFRDFVFGVQNATIFGFKKSLWIIQNSRVSWNESRARKKRQFFAQSRIKQQSGFDPKIGLAYEPLHVNKDKASFKQYLTSVCALFALAPKYISNLYSRTFKNAKRDRLDLERAVAKEQREHLTLLEQVERKKNLLSNKTEEIHRQIDTKKVILERKLDAEAEQIKHASQTSFNRLSPIHNYLRTKSKLYYIWHLNPYSNYLHFGALVVFLAAAISFMQYLYPIMYNRALADSLTCTWNGSADSNWDNTANWTGCNSGTPGALDYLSFSGAPTNNLVMTSNKTVAKVEALTAGNFSKTFDTNYYNLTVNGDFTWQKGTLTFGGTSEITVTGNFEISGSPTFNYNASTLILSGAGDTALNINKDLYNLTIDKTNASNTVTLSQATSNVRNTFSLKKGSLNSNTLALTQANATYSIGKDSNGGTSTVALTGDAQAVVASGGTATTNTTISGSGYSYTWDGSANIKFLNINLGTLNIRSGRIIIPNDPALGKITLADNAAAILNLDGNAQGTTMLELRSDSAGNQWDLEKGAAGTLTADWVDLRDSNVTAATSVTNGIDSGNNAANWSITALANQNLWLSDSSSSWETAGNWSLGHKPSATEYAVFTVAHNGNCTLGAAASTLGIISTDYTGTLDTSSADNYSLSTTGVSSAFTWGSGTFSGNGSTVSMASISLIGGVYTASSATTTITSHAVLTPTTFTHSNGKIKFEQSLSIYGSQDLYNLEFSAPAAYTFTISAGTTLTANNILTYSGDQNIVVDTGNINLKGNLQNTNTAANGGGTATITFNGTGDQTIDGSPAKMQGALSNVAIRKTQGLLTLLNFITVKGEWRTDSQSGLTNSGSTLVFSGNKEITGSINLNNLEFNISTSATYNITSGTIITVNGTLTSSDTSAVNINTGDIYAKGNINIANSYSGGGGTATITLNGTVDQTITGPGTVLQGRLPNLVVNKTSGKVLVTNTVSFDQNITVTAGVLEFQGGSSGGYTYTMTAGRTMSVASGATVRFVGTAGNNVTLTSSNNWTLTKTGNVYANYVVVDHSQASATVYATNSSYGGGSETNANWDYSSSNKTWDGGAGTLVWNDGNNWDPDGAPEGNDTVILDVASTITTNADISFGSLTLGGTTATTLLLTNNFAVAGNLTVAASGTFEQKNKVNQILSGSLLVQSGGLMTHTANTNYSAPEENSVLYRLSFTAGDSVTVDSGGSINVNGKGYTYDQGPGSFDYGNARNYHTASYGGRAKSTSTTANSATYGSFDNPVSLGSGSSGDHSCGAGGGAAIISAGGGIIVNGQISSDGTNLVEGCGEGWQYNSGSGGSVNLSTSNITGSGNIYARGGPTKSYPGFRGGGGGRIGLYNTGHIEFSGKVSAEGQADDASRTGLPGTVSLPPSVRSGSFVVGTGSSGQNYIKNLVLGTDDQAADYNFGTLTVKSDGVLTVGGNPSLAGNHGATDPADNLGSASKIVVNGGTTVDQGGTITSSGQGFGAYVETKFRNSSGGHWQGTTSSQTYGSRENPNNLGSGAGAVILEVNGVLTNNGSINSDSVVSNGSSMLHQPSDSGGSVNIKAQSIAGSSTGSISAKGYYNSGGRIALSKYGAGDLAFNFSGFIGAGSLDALSYAPGTVYLGSNSGSDLHVGSSGTNYIGSLILGTDDQATDNSFNTLHILNGGALYVGGNSCLNLVGGLYEGSSSKIVAANLTVDSGGLLSADKYGFRNSGPYYVSNGGGASYGGYGSGQYSTYGSIDNPTSLGSSNKPFHYGGGALIINVSGTFTNNGIVSASASTDAYRDTATGGTINLTADTISGTGSISTNASQYHTDSTVGGGGRLAIKYTNGNPTNYTLKSYGGYYHSNGYAGGPGTIFSKKLSESNGNLIIKSLYNAQLNTPIKLTSDLKTYSNISVSNTARLSLEPDSSDPIDNTVNVTGDVTTSSGARLIFENEKDHDPAAGRGVTLNANNIVVNSGSYIESNGRGYAAQNGYSDQSKGQDGATCGGGGGFGGAGGAGAGGCAGGTSYGASNQVAYVGSGGGLAEGGAGGGYFKLTASNSLTNAGTISANGYSATVNGGGGSGGGFIVESPTITSSGTISANGGNGAGNGGGGGGGRIFIISNTNPAAGQVNGGAGITNGSSGTYMFQRSPAQSTAILPSDGAINQSQTAAMTFSATDADGDYLRYKVEMADDSGFSTNLHTFAQGADVGGQTVSDNGLTVAFSGQNTQSSTAYNSGTTATATVSSSTPLLQGHIYYWRVSAIDPAGVDSYDGTPHYGPTSAVRNFTVSAIDKLVISAGADQTVANNICSSVLTVEVRNINNEPVKLLANTTLNLVDSDSAHGNHFYSDATCLSAISTVTVSNGQSNANFYYKSTHATFAPFNLAVTDNPPNSTNWSDATTTIKILPDILHHFTAATYPASRTTEQTFTDPIVVTAYDQFNNVKYDYSGVNAKVWFTSTTDNYAYTSELPAKSTNRYQFISDDRGAKSFAGASFKLKKIGNQTITLHHQAYDGRPEDSMTAISGPISITPGEAYDFVLEDYPAMAPDLSKYVVSGSSWEFGGAGSPYDIKVTVKDQYGNIKTDYQNRKVWFELYNSLGEQADYSFTYDSEGNAYSFTAQDAGVHSISPTAFVSQSSGKNMILRVANETIHHDYLIYIKPLGLDHFTITTSPTLSREGTNWDKDNDIAWNESVTVTAYDVLGYTKVDYAADANTGYGYIYFWSPERDAVSPQGILYNNQEFPYYRSGSTDVTQCMPFPLEAAGVYTFSPDSEVFKFFRGGRRTVYVSECVTPTSSYAVENTLRDPHFPDVAWNSWPNDVKKGVMPSSNPPATIAVATHVPGSTHTTDQHTDNNNDNFTIGPGDQKLTLSWKNPADAPANANATIQIYQSSNGIDYNLLAIPRPFLNSAGMWQSQDVSGLTNDQVYSFKLRMSYKRSDGSEILSDYSIVKSGTPKAIAPLDVNAIQLDRTDAAYPGQVKVDYKLRFESNTSFEYFNPVDLSWAPISNSAVSGDKGIIDGNFESPVEHTSYIEMNTDFAEQFLAGSFKLRVNVSVSGQGESNSESNLLTLDSKNPSSTSLIVDASNNTSANLSISASDDSPPMLMMISNDAGFAGANWEAYATSKASYNITGASTVYAKFRDLYYNDTTVSTDIRPIPQSFQIKDASNISDGKFRLVLIWNDAAGVDHYNVWRSVDGVNYSQIKEVTENGFLNINLDSNIVYGYKVTSEDANHNISLPAGPLYSQPGSAPDVTAAPSVELFGWRQDRGVAAKITWNTDQLADSNVAYSKGELNVGPDMTAKGGENVQIAANPEMTFSHEINILNLEPSTTYYFKAFSKNEIQIAGYSAVSSFKTSERVPLLIQGMTISDITLSSALVDWDTSKAATTTLEYSSTAIVGDATPADAKNITDPNFNSDHTFKLSELNIGTKYYVRARNTDSDGNTTVSDVYSFSTPSLPEISGVTVKEAVYNSATIDWTTNVNTDSNVEFGVGGALSGTQGKADSTQIHSVTLIGLEAKTAYSFRVISKDVFGNAAVSSTQSFTTATDSIAPKISNIKSEVASIGAGDAIKYQAIISWDTDEPATSQIEFAMGIGGDYTDKTEEMVSLNSSHVIILPDLKANSAYHMRIVSKDKAGNVGNSEDTSLITPPKEKSLLQIIIKSLEETFSWVGRLRDKWMKK